MLSRTADSLFWMSRYMERLDFISKILLVGFSSTYDFQINSKNNFDWGAIARIFYSDPDLFVPEETPSNQVFRMLIAGDSNNSLKELITKARENARGVQEHISKEVWESINRKYHTLIKTDPEEIIRKEKQLDFLFTLQEDNQKYAGVFDNTNHRGEGWNFMNLGKYCERCILTLSLSEEKFDHEEVFTEAANNILYWKNFLLSLSGFELYIKNYRSGNNSVQVLDMVLFNREFTRSISFTVNRIKSYTQNIINENPNPNNDKLRKEIGMLSAKINYSETDSVTENGVIPFFRDIKGSVYKVTESIGHIFFSYY